MPPKVKAKKNLRFASVGFLIHLSVSLCINFKKGFFVAVLVGSK